MTGVWEISDSWFLVLYVVLLGLAALAAGRAYWAAAKPGSHRLREPVELDPYELAVLNSRDEQAVIIALARLKETGSVQLDTSGKTIMTSGSLPAGAHPVERAVHALIGSDQSRPLRAVRSQARKAKIVNELRQHLSGHGLLQDPACVQRVLLQALWLVPVLVLGGGWLWARLQEANRQGVDESSNDVVVAVFLSLFVMAIVVMAAEIRGLRALSGTPRLTLRGHLTLQRYYHRFERLSPDCGFVSLPISALAWGLALFGLAPLWNTDARFAAALELPRETAARHFKRHVLRRILE